MSLYRILRIYIFIRSVQVTKDSNPVVQQPPANQAHKSTLDSMLDTLKGPKVISTISKSSIDWANYKEQEGLQDALVGASKDGYVVITYELRLLVGLLVLLLLLYILLYSILARYFFSFPDSCLPSQVLGSQGVPESMRCTEFRNRTRRTHPEACQQFGPRRRCTCTLVVRCVVRGIRCTVLPVTKEAPECQSLLYSLYGVLSYTKYILKLNSVS